MRKQEEKRPSLPKREEIIKFITENPDLSHKRDIARAFGVRGAHRVGLKEMLRALEAEGIIEKKGKRQTIRDRLPPVTLLDIFGRDGDGDLLARPVLKDEAGRKSEKLLIDGPVVALRPTRGERIAAGVGDRVLARIFASKEQGDFAYHGRIMRKIDRRERRFLGILRQISTGEWRLKPISRKDSEMIVDAASLQEAQAGDLVEVEIDAGKTHHFGLKQTRLHAIVGHIDNEKSLSTIALYAHGIPHVFPSNVLEEADQINISSVDLLKAREDWRQIDFITIDPPDAKDHDDAVYAEADRNPKNAGGHVVMVAIADVAAYVSPGSWLDQEAEKRGNSVYFPDRVIPMLPERISNDLCSLREGEDRPALAVRMVFDAQGVRHAASFHRIMMRSRAKLSYEEAQKALDGVVSDKTAPLIETILKPLADAFHVLRRARDKRGTLDLDVPEKKILLDEEGCVRDVIVPERLETHRLIEEMMIAANVAAAEILQQAAQPLIYRIHDQPSLAKQEILRDFLHSLGLSLPRGVELTPGRLNIILRQVAGSDIQELVNQMILRAQAQAEYSPENIGHFGLALKNYAHFTSPIRRYADLLVHRALIKALKLAEGGLTTAQEARMGEIATAISACERRAMVAERETVDRLIAHYLADKAGAEFAGRIRGVTKSGLFVALDDLGADGFIPVATLGQDYYHYDEALHALIGARSRLGFQLADRVQVRLVEAVPLAGALRFDMLTPPHALPPSTLSYHKSTKGRFPRSGSKNRKASSPSRR